MDSLIHSNRFFNVIENGDRIYIQRPSAVLILPISNSNKILMVRQFREIMNKYTWELPGGIIEQDETPLTAAIRELKEETGFISEKITQVCIRDTSNGTTNEQIFFFKALDVNYLSKSIEEGIDLNLFSLSECLDMVFNGTIDCLSTSFAILFYSSKND
jgi:ADP-ribose pyrophosphatase